MATLAVAIDPDIQKKIVQIARNYPISYLALFGSYARGTATSKSDIDIAVRFSQPIDLLTFVGIQLEMEALLERSVDLIPLDNVYTFVRESMTPDLIVLYEDPRYVNQS